MNGIPAVVVVKVAKKTSIRPLPSNQIGRAHV